MSESSFNKLSQVNVNDKTKAKNNLTYLSWAFAWGEVKKIYPESSYSVDSYDGKPYLHDEALGYLVSTVVTIDGQSIPMSLPVMDGANKAMNSSPYTYKTKYGEKSVEAATMFDINKTMMRCLVKNIAMFGLGLYIYAGEDLPDEPIQSAEDRAVDMSNLQEHIVNCGFTVEGVCGSYDIKSLSELKDLKSVINQITEWRKG